MLSAGTAPIYEEEEEIEVSSEGESYDRLDFTRPTHELAPHYTSSDTLRSVSVSPCRGTSPHSVGGQDTDRSDFTRDVLQCVDNLQSMTRKTVYQPETPEEDGIVDL